jgi:hypothetical protein
VGLPLFQLEDDLIGSLCYGFSDGETKQFFADALEEGRLEVQKSVRERMRSHPVMKEYADDTEVRLVGQDFVVLVPEDVEDELLDIEYGNGVERPSPVLRPGLQQSATAASKKITNMLDMP